MSLTHEDVQEIVALLDAANATELHLRTRHFTLSLRRAEPDGEWVQATSALSTPHVLGTEQDSPHGPPPHAANPSSDPAPPPRPASTAPATADGHGLVDVRTPLMGTFYRAPKPGTPPYVEVGDAVEENTVVGLIETMKLFNSVYAEVRGRVAEICLDNAEVAEQGAVLMRVVPEQPE